MEVTAWSQDLTVEVAGHGVVSHAGSAVVRMIADGTGLTAGLSKALSRRGFVPVHDRGQVLADAAVLIAGGGRVRAKVRAHAWGLIEARHGRIPSSRVADRELGKTIVVRMDASILISHPPSIACRNRPGRRCLTPRGTRVSVTTPGWWS